MKKRMFLLGGAAILTGGGLFALNWTHQSSISQAQAITAQSNEASFNGWLKIAADDTVTVYSPHIDFGQGTHTALAQMIADELDADWNKIRVEQAPADSSFANQGLVRATLIEMTQFSDSLGSFSDIIFSQVARSMDLQVTGGSSSIRMTGQYGMRILGASVRIALIEAAAAKWNVSVADVTASSSKLTNVKSKEVLSYGQIASEAAQRSLQIRPQLKEKKDFKIIGTSPERSDIPSKVNGQAVYGIDFKLLNMRVAAIKAAPIRGGKLISVDERPALAIAGVEKVISLDNAVAVVATGYWPAQQALNQLTPKFSDGGFSKISSESIRVDQLNLLSGAKATEGAYTAIYHVPFLHQATMEPLSLSAEFKDGKINVWGGLQDPLTARAMIAGYSGLAIENVTFHPMIMGGGFGRRFPNTCQHIEQIVKIAMQVPYPVKLIWSREEDVTQGAYRPQMTARLAATLSNDKKIASWSNDYVQNADATEAAGVPYQIQKVETKLYNYISNQQEAFWRAVDHSQHGFYTECFMDEMAQQAGEDPYAFRRKHLIEGSRHIKVLDAVAKLAKWNEPLPTGVGRGIALVKSMGSIVAQVVEASIPEGGVPKVHHVYAAVDCGIVVHPQNAEAQVQGAIIMGISAALGEKITLQDGAVVQSNFADYPVIKIADVPPIEINFIESEAAPGGLGEPGLPPVAPALANALFAASGIRFRGLPILG